MAACRFVLCLINY